jgi:FPC/CPF motif-containing protein YcgG
MADQAFRAFVLSDRFSCVAGKAAVQSGGYRFGYYNGFPATEATSGLARDLAAFVLERPFMGVRYATFVALFGNAAAGDEGWFERSLWEQLTRLHELDARRFSWDSRASSDPASPRFAFSFAGTAFYVVGMHPGSSRASRRFSMPALIFNAHAQFEQARRTGQYRRIQGLVREREFILQGCLNPELRDYGEASEARQYSGRHTEAQWQCPFRHHS